jgi:polyhydroxyalkanoate synthesis regulator phasin
MAFEYVRGYVQLASGLGELTKARATEAAQGLLSLPGAGEVGKRAMQVTEFADQLLEAARANRESLLALIRSEVESALGRSDVVRLADFDRARTALAALTREVDDLRASLMAEASRSPLGRALPGAPSRATVPPAVQPATEAVAAAATTAAPTTRETTRPGAKKTAARKSTAKKTSAKKAPAQKAAAKKTAGAQTAQKAAKKATAKKATAKKATARKSTAKKTSAKSTATKAASQAPTPSTSDSTTSNGNGTA